MLALTTVKNQVHGNVIRCRLILDIDIKRICQKYKQGVQKSFKMRRLFKRYVVGIVLKSSQLLSLVDEVFIARNIFVLSIILPVSKGGKKLLKGIIVT